MSDCGCHDTAATLSKNSDHARRRVLWIVLAINMLLFAGEFGAGWWADSSALQADSLDSLGDALVYGLSLWVIGGTLRQRTKAVFLKGGIQALFGIAVLIEVARRAWMGAEPLAPVMAIAAAVALVGFYPEITDGCKRAENFWSCLATLRRILGLWNRSMYSNTSALAASSVG